jgi:hypothetical protein
MPQTTAQDHRSGDRGTVMASTGPANIPHEPITHAANRNTHPTPARARSGLASIVGEGRVEDEQVGGDVGIEVVAADECDDVAAGEPFDGRARIFF